MEMEDQLTPTQIKIIAGWSHNYRMHWLDKLRLICLIIGIYVMIWSIIWTKMI